jgi:repressor LexA
MSHKEQEPAEPFTPRQVQLLKVIIESGTRDGYSPTIGELAQAVGISRTTAFGHIGQLRKKGLVSGLSGPSTKLRARSLTLTSKARRLLKQISSCVARDASRDQISQDAIRNTESSESRLGGTHDKTDGGIPLLGKVAAGLPVEAIENRDHISIESCFGTGDDVFALQVRGDSMSGENINDGDYVICRRSSSAVDGQLVVAIVDNDNATLKRFFKESPASPLATPWQVGRVRLQPANDAYEPIYSDNCRIEGVVIGLIRKL